LMFTTLLNFCSNDLSSFHFDIRKDVIYCDNIKSTKRRSARTLLNILFDYLVRWLAPTLTFTCEEAWNARGKKTSIHLEEFLSSDVKFKNINLANKWEKLKNIRKVITGALEKKRSEKIIGSSLEANVNLFLSKDYADDIKSDFDIAELSITSFGTISILDQVTNCEFTLDDVKGVGVTIEKVSGEKCERCWKFYENIQDNNICKRCLDAIK